MKKVDMMSHLGTYETFESSAFNTTEEVPDAAEVFHDVLIHSADIRNVRWYQSKDMSTHREDMSATSPLG